MRICMFAEPNAVHTRRLVSALAERGFHLHVVHKGPAEVPAATYESFAVPRLTLSNLHRRSVRRHRYLARFFREFDVVGVCFLSNWGFGPQEMELGRLALWSWGSDVCPPPGTPPMSSLSIARRRIMLRHAHAIAACSNWLARATANFGCIEIGRVQIVPLGVDLNLFKPTSDPAGAPVVGFLKGFGHAYGAEHLVRAMPGIVAAVPNAEFEMVGDGPMLGPCRELAAALKVAGRVRWTSAVPHHDVPFLLRRWQVSVIPSVCESFGVAALESSAMGVPVVASNVGGLPETVLDGQTGRLVPPGDSSGIAGAVVELLRQKEKRVQMGAAGRRFVMEHFDWDLCVPRWVEFFESTATNGR